MENQLPNQNQLSELKPFINSDLRLQCMELAKEILTNGVAFIGLTEKQGESRNKFNSFLTDLVCEPNHNFFALLNRNSGDEISINNFKAAPTISDIILFGNKLYQFCIQDEDGISKICEEIKNAHIADQKAKAEDLELKEKQRKEAVEAERMRAEQIATEKENVIIELEALLFAQKNEKYHLDRDKRLSELKEYTCNELLKTS